MADRVEPVADGRGGPRGGVTAFAAALAREIAVAGPLPVAAWMARCNTQYYATRDPFGAAGDFVTAPEISQMFGELVGVWLVDAWRRAGAPPGAKLVELGPGRGTLMADICRVTASAGWAHDVVFVETSPRQAAQQRRSNPAATAAPTLAQVDDTAPQWFVANEFFDALPVRQLVRAADGWRERVVGVDGAGFVSGLDPADAAAAVPPALADAPVGSVVELSPASTAIAAEIGARVARHGGAALIVDYGHAGPATGDTLQAVRAHAAADPFADPGDVDLTCHVDFTALAVAAGVTAWGPVGQGGFLRALGIDARAAALKARATLSQAAAIDAAVERLTGDVAMGRLFRVMALTAGGPAPPGFA